MLAPCTMRQASTAQATLAIILSRWSVFVSLGTALFVPSDGETMAMAHATPHLLVHQRRQ